MKQKYLLLNMILLVFLIFSITSFSVLAITPNLELTPSSQSVSVGNQATINIVVEEVTDLRGANIILNFDASKLQYVSSSDAGFIPSTTLLEQFIDNINGSVTLDIAGIGASAYASGSGTIITVVLERIADGNTNITFGATELRGKDNNPITHTTGSGCLITFCIGDFGGPNGYPDNKVDFEDLMIFALAYGSSPGDANWNSACDIAGPGGSLNPDGVIDFEDLMIFAMHYGDDCGSCTLPPAPTLYDPGSTLASPATYNVDWSSVTEAASYKIQEAASSNFSSGLQEYTTTSSNRSFSHTVSSTTTYYYRVAAVNSCGQGGWSNVEDIEIEVAPSGDAAWTIMVYIDGDNNLDDCAWDDLSELESVSSTDEIKIVAQLDAYSCSGTFRYYITGSAPGISYPLYPNDIVQTLSEQNMADPDTLTSFINWSTTNYPAEKYLLVLWNHGGGWRENNIPSKGVIWDDTSGEFMTMAELVQGLNGANEGIDIIGFDACLMQMAEVAYELSGLTNLPDYMVGSQASEWGDGWPYDDILAHLLANPGMTEGTVCETIVDDFINYCGSVGTLSVLDFSAGTYDTYTALNSFTLALMASSYQDEIAAARSSAQSYSYSDGFRIKDLYDFAERIKNSVPDCQSEALAVMNQVNDLVLYESHTGSGVANSHGLSIYLPDNAGEYDDDYNDLQFAIDTQWDEFLQGGQSGQDKVTDVSAIAITYTSDDMSRLKEKMNQLKSEENVSSYYMLNEPKPLKKGIVEKLIKIDWRAYPEATGYRIYKSINGAGYSLIKDWQVPSGYDWYALWDYDVIEGNTYSYYVVAYGSFGETSPSQETLTIDTWLPDCSLINPYNGSAITDPTPTFNWNPAGVSSFPYGSITEGESDLWVYDENVSSTSWWPLFNNMTTSSATYNQDGQATPLVSGHNYTWNSWAYGYDGDGNLIAMSESEDWGFNYGSCTLPPAPTLYDPGSTLASPATYTVSWSSVPEAASYVLQEATSSSFSGATSYPLSGTSRSFSHTVTTTTTYYYRVAAVNSCGQSGWSNVENIAIVNETGPVHNITKDIYYNTIQTALDEADTNNTIEVSNGTYDESIIFPSGKKIILRSMNGAPSTIIRGNANSPTVHLENSLTGTTLEGFNITHASTNEGRGIYINGGYVIINDCTISGNNSDLNGGGIYNNGNTTINVSTISNNTADTINVNTGCFGGGLLNSDILTINGSTISNNISDAGGGGILNWQNSTLTIIDSTISDNYASDFCGGGIWNYSGGNLTITGSIISDNSVHGFAAGICTSIDTGIINIGGDSEDDKNTICGNYRSGYSPSLDQQIRSGSESLYEIYKDTNYISAYCGGSDPVVRRALLVGVGDYLYGDNDLPAPPYDVDKMHDTLNHSGDGFALINELKDLQATKSAILSGIASTFSQTDADDVSYFYFSGHGGLLENISYLIPTDSDGYISTCISVSELESALNAIPGTKVVIIDSCHSGGFIGKQTSDEEIISTAQEFNDNVINVFLSRVLTSSQYKVLTSCLSSQLSWEVYQSSVGDYWWGLFSRFLCEGCGYDSYIHPYPADDNGNGEITLHEAYTYTDEQVTIKATELNDLYGWDIDQDTQIYPLNSDFVIIEE